MKYIKKRGKFSRSRSDSRGGSTKSPSNVVKNVGLVFQDFEASMDTSAVEIDTEAKNKKCEVSCGLSHGKLVSDDHCNDFSRKKNCSTKVPSAENPFGRSTHLNEVISSSNPHIFSNPTKKNELLVSNLPTGMIDTLKAIEMKLISNPALKIISPKCCTLPLSSSSVPVLKTYKKPTFSAKCVVQNKDEWNKYMLGKKAKTCNADGGKTKKKGKRSADSKTDTNLGADKSSTDNSPNKTDTSSFDTSKLNEESSDVVEDINITVNKSDINCPNNSFNTKKSRRKSGKVKANKSKKRESGEKCIVDSIYNSHSNIDNIEPQLLSETSKNSNNCTTETLEKNLEQFEQIPNATKICSSKLKRPKTKKHVKSPLCNTEEPQKNIEQITHSSPRSKRIKTQNLNKSLIETIDINNDQRIKTRKVTGSDENLERTLDISLEKNSLPIHSASLSNLEFPRKRKISDTSKEEKNENYQEITTKIPKGRKRSRYSNNSNIEDNEINAPLLYESSEVPFNHENQVNRSCELLPNSEETKFHNLETIETEGKTKQKFKRKNKKKSQLVQDNSFTPENEINVAQLDENLSTSINYDQINSSLELQSSKLKKIASDTSTQSTRKTRRCSHQNQNDNTCTDKTDSNLKENLDTSINPETDQNIVAPNNINAESTSPKKHKKSSKQKQSNNITEKSLVNFDSPNSEKNILNNLEMAINKSEKGQKKLSKIKKSSKQKQHSFTEDNESYPFQAEENLETRTNSSADNINSDAISSNLETTVSNDPKIEESKKKKLLDIHTEVNDNTEEPQEKLNTTINSINKSIEFNPSEFVETKSKNLETVVNDDNSIRRRTRSHDDSFIKDNKNNVTEEQPNLDNNLEVNSPKTSAANINNNAEIHSPKSTTKSSNLETTVQNDEDEQKRQINKSVKNNLLDIRTEDNNKKEPQENLDFMNIDTNKSLDSHLDFSSPNCVETKSQSLETVLNDDSSVETTEITTVRRTRSNQDTSLVKHDNNSADIQQNLDNLEPDSPKTKEIDRQKLKFMNYLEIDTNEYKESLKNADTEQNVRLSTKLEKIRDKNKKFKAAKTTENTDIINTNLELHQRDTVEEIRNKYSVILNCDLNPSVCIEKIVEFSPNQWVSKNATDHSVETEKNKVIPDPKALDEGTDMIDLNSIKSEELSPKIILQDVMIVLEDINKNEKTNNLNRSWNLTQIEQCSSPGFRNELFSVSSQSLTKLTEEFYSKSPVNSPEKSLVNSPEKSLVNSPVKSSVKSSCTSPVKSSFKPPLILEKVSNSDTDDKIKNLPSKEIDTNLSICEKDLSDKKSPMCLRKLSPEKMRVESQKLKVKKPEEHPEKLRIVDKHVQEEIKTCEMPKTDHESNKLSAESEILDTEKEVVESNTNNKLNSSKNRIRSTSLSKLFTQPETIIKPSIIAAQNNQIKNASVTPESLSDISDTIVNTESEKLKEIQKPGNSSAELTKNEITSSENLETERKKLSHKTLKIEKGPIKTIQTKGKKIHLSRKTIRLKSPEKTTKESEIKPVNSEIVSKVNEKIKIVPHRTHSESEKLQKNKIHDKFSAELNKKEIVQKGKLEESMKIKSGPEKIENNDNVKTDRIRDDKINYSRSKIRLKPVENEKSNKLKLINEKIQLRRLAALANTERVEPPKSLIKLNKREKNTLKENEICIENESKNIFSDSAKLEVMKSSQTANTTNEKINSTKKTIRIESSKKIYSNPMKLIKLPTKIDSETKINEKDLPDGHVNEVPQNVTKSVRRPSPIKFTKIDKVLQINENVIKEITPTSPKKQLHINCNASLALSNEKQKHSHDLESKKLEIPQQPSDSVKICDKNISELSNEKLTPENSISPASSKVHIFLFPEKSSIKRPPTRTPQRIILNRKAPDLFKVPESPATQIVKSESLTYISPKSESKKFVKSESFTNISPKWGSKKLNTKPERELDAISLYADMDAIGLESVADTASIRNDDSDSDNDFTDDILNTISPPMESIKHTNVNEWVDSTLKICKIQKQYLIDESNNLSVSQNNNEDVSLQKIPPKREPVSPGEKTKIPAKREPVSPCEKPHTRVTEVQEKNLKNESSTDTNFSQSSHQVLPKHQEAINIFKYICHSIKTSGECHRKLDCKFKHDFPSNWQTELTNTSIESVLALYDTVKKDNSVFLMKKIFSTITGFLGENRDFNNLIKMVRDVLVINMNSDRAPFINDIISALCKTGVTFHSIVEVVYKIADVDKSLINLLSDILLNLTVEKGDSYENWLIIKELMLQKNYDLDIGIIRSIIIESLQPNSIKKDFFLKIYHDLIRKISNDKLCLIFESVLNNFHSRLLKLNLTTEASELFTRCHALNITFGNKSDHSTSPSSPASTTKNVSKVSPFKNTLQREIKKESVSPLSSITKFITPIKPQIPQPPPIPNLLTSLPAICQSTSMRRPSNFPPFASNDFTLPPPGYKKSVWPRGRNRKRSMSSHLGILGPSPVAAFGLHNQFPVQCLSEQILSTLEAAIAEENVPVIFGLIMQYKDNNLTDIFIKNAVRIILNTNHNFPTFFGNLCQAKTIHKLEDKALSYVYKTIGLNIILHLTGLCNWDQAFIIYKTLRGNFEEDLFNVKIYLPDNFSYLKRILVIAQLHVKKMEFDIAWAMLKDHCFQYNSWQNENKDLEISFRNNIIEELLASVAKNKKWRTGLSIVQYIMIHSISDIDIKKYNDEILLRAINSKCSMMEVMEFVNCSQNWYNYVSKYTFRAIVTHAVYSNSWSTAKKFYEIGCKFDIYPELTGHERLLNIPIYYVFEEIWLMFEILLENMVRYRPIRHNLVIRILNHTWMTPAEELPIILQQYQITPATMQVRLVNILNNYIKPAITIIKQHNSIIINADVLNKHLEGRTRRE